MGNGPCCLPDKGPCLAQDKGVPYKDDVSSAVAAGRASAEVLARYYCPYLRP